MNLILILIILIQILIIIFQCIRYKKRSSSIGYITQKLKSITLDNEYSNLLLFTDDKELINLLIEINLLLDNYQNSIANYNKSQLSMRKMLSNISHDLKTPLTVVLGYIEILQLDNNISAQERNQLLSNTENKAKEVLALIKKFFDLAKLESEDKDIPISKVNLSEICRNSILSFWDILNTKGVDVDINVPENNIFVYGNEDALKSVINNLLSNSIKYGLDGNVIGLVLRHDEKFVYVDVWDKGKGIDEVHIDRVFERMYTLDDSRNSLNQSSGLGLTITKRLVEKLGGDISLYSKAFEKTVFTVKLKRMYY